MVDDSYHGTWTLIESQEEVTLTDSNAEHGFCSQNLLRKFTVSPLPSLILDHNEWMNSSQQTFSQIFVWVMIGILIVIVATIVLWTVSRAIYTLFFRDFKVSKTLDDRRFEDVEEIRGYVPQVVVNGYIYPFLLCDIGQIDNDIIGWSDAYSTYDAHNLIYDVPKVAAAKYQLGTDSKLSSVSFADNEVEVISCSDPPIFSIAKSWVKPLQKSEQQENDDEVEFEML